MILAWAVDAIAMDKFAIGAASLVADISVGAGAAANAHTGVGDAAAVIATRFQYGTYCG